MWVLLRMCYLHKLCPFILCVIIALFFFKAEDECHSFCLRTLLVSSPQGWAELLRAWIKLYWPNHRVSFVVQEKRRPSRFFSCRSSLMADIYIIHWFYYLTLNEVPLFRQHKLFSHPITHAISYTCHVTLVSSERALYCPSVLALMCVHILLFLCWLNKGWVRLSMYFWRSELPMSIFIFMQSLKANIL